MNKDLINTIRHAGIFSLLILVNRGVSFIMLPIYTRFLTPADYGILELIEMTVDIISVIAGMGILSGLFKFYYQFKEEHDKKELVSTMFIMVIIFYFVACFLGGMSSSFLSSLIFRTEKYTSYITIAFINLFLQSTLCFVPLVYLRAQQRSSFFVVVSGIKLIIQLTLNILFVVYLEMGVMGVLYSSMISSLGIGLSMTTYTFSRIGFQLSKDKAKMLFNFGYPFVFSSLATFILTFSDRYFLNHYFELSVVGIYSLAYKFGFLLASFPIAPIMNIWMVQRFELINKDGYEKIYNQFFSWFCIISLSAALLISMAVRDVIRVMSAPSFWDAYKIVPIIVLAYFFQPCTDFFNFGIYHTGKTKHIAYSNLFSSIVIIALSFLLIPRYGALGAAWATLISFTVRLLYVYIISQKLFKIQYALGRPIGTLIISIAVYLGYHGIVSFPLFDKLFLSSAMTMFLLLVFFVLLFSFNIIKTEEKRSIMNSLRSPVKSLMEIRNQLAS